MKKCLIVKLVKCAALLAMKGMMLQENATLDEALRKMEEGQMANSKGPALPPRVIGKILLLRLK